jgi:hypothetical protein
MYAHMNPNIAEPRHPFSADDTQALKWIRVIQDRIIGQRWQGDASPRTPRKRGKCGAKWRQARSGHSWNVVQSAVE